MTQFGAQSNWRITHGIVFVLLAASVQLIAVFRTWPWTWLAALIAYFLVVACIPPLRRSLVWLRFGLLSTGRVLATISVIAITSLVLFAFHATIKPEASDYRTVLPLGAMGGTLMAGAIFIFTNAILEEFVFRGVLFDALEAQWGMPFTLIATSLFFGIGHLRGYPPGLIGAALAAVFGLLMGALRVWTGGLALPILAHMGADATIYIILISSRG